MWPLLVLLIIIAGVIIAIFLVFYILYLKLKNAVGTENANMLIDAVKNAANATKDEYGRIKEVAGITSIAVPNIKRTFSSFSENVLYNKVEKSIRSYLDSIENKNVANMEKEEDMEYIIGDTRNQIDDMYGSGTELRFDNIVFNNHAIKKYKYDNGAAIITVGSSVGYYYSSNIKKDLVYDDIRKQTRYITEWVYVYDENKFNKKSVNFSVHCPNCGAPLNKIGDTTCNYCGIYVEPLNLKAWKLLSIKEDTR